MSKYLNKEDLSILNFNLKLEDRGKNYNKDKDKDKINVINIRSNFLVKYDDFISLTKNDYLNLKSIIIFNALYKIQKDKFYFIMYYLYYNRNVNFNLIKSVYELELSIIQIINKNLIGNFYLENKFDTNKKFILKFNSYNRLINRLFKSLNLNLDNKLIVIFDNDLYISDDCLNDKYNGNYFLVDSTIKFIYYFKFFKKLKYDYKNYIFNAT